MDYVERARKAQQDYEQSHDVQLEIETRITACCSDGLHEHCSGRVTTNPGAGWHELHYTACRCECHA